MQRIAEQVLEQLQRQPDPALAMLAHNVRGTALLFVGDAAASLEHVDQTLALYDEAAHRHLAITYGEDPAVACHHCAALARWVLGDADAAARHLREGSALARRLAHAFGQAQMLWAEAVIALDGDDLDRVERSTRRLNELCADYGFALWPAGGQILRGAALAGRGEVEEGIALTDTGLRAWQDARTLLTLPHALAVAARVQALAGRTDTALALLDEALAVAARTGERWYEPELHRLHGELLLQLPDAGAVGAARAETKKKATASFERAISLARTQQATLLEARATASLAQLSRQITAEITPRS